MRSSSNACPIRRIATSILSPGASVFCFTHITLWSFLSLAPSLFHKLTPSPVACRLPPAACRYRPLLPSLRHPFLSPSLLFSCLRSFLDDDAFNPDKRYTTSSFVRLDLPFSTYFRRMHRVEAICLGTILLHSPTCSSFRACSRVARPGCPKAHLPLTTPPVAQLDGPIALSSEKPPSPISHGPRFLSEPSEITLHLRLFYSLLSPHLSLFASPPLWPIPSLARRATVLQSRDW